MKTALITATILALALASGSASALELRTTDARSLYTCAGAGLSRIAAKVEPASCCDGMLGCPQLLANSGLIRAKRSNRT